MTYVLGLNAYHGDSSACLVDNGILVAAAEEERFRRIKHWAGFPTEAIRYCLSEAGISLVKVDHVAINRDPKANVWKKVAYSLAKRPDPRFILDRLKKAKEIASLEEQFARFLPDQELRAKTHHVEHHFAHLASAYLASSFEDAVTVSVDGFGDFASAAWGLGHGGKLEVDNKVFFPHSLGIFYQALTQYIGFPHYGDEYKAMGLAPYGQPRFIKEMRRIVRTCDDGSFRLNLDFFRHARERVSFEWDGGAPSVGTLFTPNLENLLGKARQLTNPLEQRHRDIARSMQVRYEEAFFHLLNTLHRRYRCNNLALAGGCAMNSVANGKITRSTPFRRVYIQAAAGDAGGAIGAALAVAREMAPDVKRFVMDHAYFGPSYTSEEINGAIQGYSDEIEASGCTLEHISDDKTLYQRTARLIAKGKVVGWFQGRMEWGPRALGNRSIVCDPRAADMKDILNQKIKRRESYRPFAPSILREAVADWFETDDDVPFMMKVFQVREEKRHQIPAVTHVDGSGRLQTVYRNTNPRYYALIEAFRDLTGIPIVLNTSFNENEPVVCQPSEALACFLRTKMDVLVLGDYMLARKETVAD